MLEEISQALSIKFNRSEDGESFDIPTSPQKQGFPKKVKCFKCYGTSKQNCLECQGSHMITGSHPLAKLLNQVLLKKLNLSKSYSEEDLEKVYPIKQEEQDGEDKKLLCFYCSVQCEVSCFYCRLCPSFSVCSQCYSKSIDHQHELEENVRFSNCQTFNSLAKHCKNCDKTIEDFYTICRTCQGRDINYWICDNCSDNNIFKHPKDHVFEPMIQYDENKHKRIQILSQTFTEQDNEHSITYNDFLEPIELIERPININYCQAETINLNGSLRLHRNISQSSSIQFDMESSLFNSHQVGTQIKSIFRTKTKCSVQLQSNKKVKFSVFTHNSQQKQNNQAHFQQSIQHIFLDYKCDSCHSQKIVNVRYHCRMCQDYDLCEICYFSELFRHEHEHFDKIDGRVIKQKALKKIIGKERDSSIIYTRSSACMSKNRRSPLQSLLNTYL